MVTTVYLFYFRPDDACNSKTYCP